MEGPSAAGPGAPAAQTRERWAKPPARPQCGPEGGGPHPSRPGPASRVPGAPACCAASRSSAEFKLEVARRVELSRNRAAAAARAMFPQSRHPVSRRRGLDLAPLGSPRSPISPSPAPSHWMSRRADGRRAVMARLSRGRSEPCFALLSPVYMQSVRPGHSGTGGREGVGISSPGPRSFWHCLGRRRPGHQSSDLGLLSLFRAG